MKRALLALSVVLAAACGGSSNNPDASTSLPVDASAALPVDASSALPTDASSALPADGSIAAPPDASVASVPDTGVVSSRAYKGHYNDTDINNFVNAYPPTVGTRLDDCQTCHKTATLSDSGGKKYFENACNFCHLIQNPQTGLTGQPTQYSDTLNPYGADYLAAGQTIAALKSIDTKDSDGDTFANGVEIAALKYPGDPNSKPGQPAAPQKALTLDQLKAMPNHSEFLLANSQKQQYDYYATYVGVTLKDLLTAVGVDPSDANVTGVTVIAPDGYAQSEAISDINKQYPAETFYDGLDTATLGASCGFVQYPSPLPTTVADRQPIPDQELLLLAWLRDGAAMDPSSLDPTTGKIQGEGPYRLVVPQTTPGQPDRGSTATKCSDGFDYDSSADHNAGAMVRGVIAVRIDPLPAGVEDFDYQNGGWAYIANSTVIVYGYGIH